MEDSGLFLPGHLAAAMLQARLILPYTPLVSETVETAAPASVGKGRSLGLLIANVWMENRQAAAFLNVVRKSNPGMVLATETNHWWVSRLSPLQDRYPGCTRCIRCLQSRASTRNDWQGLTLGAIANARWSPQKTSADCILLEDVRAAGSGRFRYVHVLVAQGIVHVEHLDQHHANNHDRGSQDEAQRP